MSYRATRMPSCAEAARRVGTRKARCPTCRKLRRYQNLPTQSMSAPPSCGMCQPPATKPDGPPLTAFYDWAIFAWVDDGPDGIRVLAGGWPPPSM